MFSIWDDVCLLSSNGLLILAGNQYHMKKFTTFIVNLMKQEKLFSPQGGPIILAQASIIFKHGSNLMIFKWIFFVRKDSVGVIIKENSQILLTKKKEKSKIRKPCKSFKSIFSSDVKVIGLLLSSFDCLEFSNSKCYRATVLQ